ncbi:hypothetical protein KR018_003301 [Drosophila ironensis]|nr:hypothetical protein KR018_003301 [Drosophila ironensis]
MDILRRKVEACLHILERSGSSDISWLNEFCAALLEFCTLVHSAFISNKRRASAEMVCLCLSQIMTCIRQLETTMKLGCGASSSASRQYFLDRIRWCLKRLVHLHTSAADPAAGAPERLFLQLLDCTLDALKQFSAPDDRCEFPFGRSELNEDLMATSKQLRANIDTILGQTLGFANVSLAQDKRALSALCQKVARECNAFQDECSTRCRANLKLKALTLEQALSQLEDFINDALLRLVFTCFVDFEKLSVDKIRNVLRDSLESSNEDLADELIADFDVNIDRATQIGIFAIAFAPNIKVKTRIRSCLASFESLDTALIPSLQSKGADLHSEILEQHFSEEVNIFKTALQEIIDSRAFVGCYLEILTAGIADAEKSLSKQRLHDLSQMALLLLEHFQLDVNRQTIPETRDPKEAEYFEQFIRILRECKAILMCASQVEPQRIIKRFKVLRTVLRKLHNSLGVGKPAEGNGMPMAAEPVSMDGSPGELNTFSGLTSDRTSILYLTERRSRTNRPKGHQTETDSADIHLRNQKPVRSKFLKLLQYSALAFKKCVSGQSLRTAMFKRQNILESRKLYTTITNQSADLQITGE